MKKTIFTLQKQKENKEKITMITAYEYASAKILDEFGVDMILVGDSLGMVVLGYKDTLSVTIKEMIYHTKAVSRGVKNAFIVADLPFASYQTSVKDAVKNAAKLIKKGRANAVKLEGGVDYVPHIEAVAKAGIPVIAHLGLTPQFVNVLGGYKVQGKDENAAKQLIKAAQEAQNAGAFALLLECVPWQIAKKITDEVKIPVIGIGAGKHCDGQVLVWHDILGFNTDFKPKFVKTFGNVSKGIKAYIKEVREQKFPDEQHSFSASEELLKKLY